MLLRPGRVGRIGLPGGARRVIAAVVGLFFGSTTQTWGDDTTPLFGKDS